MNIKLIPAEAKAIWKPGIYIKAIYTPKSRPIKMYMNLVLSSLILIINDLLGRRI